MYGMLDRPNAEPCTFSSATCTECDLHIATSFWYRVRRYGSYVLSSFQTFDLLLDRVTVGNILVCPLARLAENVEQRVEQFRLRLWHGSATQSWPVSARTLCAHAASPVARSLCVP